MTIIFAGLCFVAAIAASIQLAYDPHRDDHDPARFGLFMFFLGVFPFYHIVEGLM